MTRKLKPRCILAVLLAAILNGAIAQNEARLMQVPGAPLDIEVYQVRYLERGTYTAEGIHHTIQVRNTTDQDVVAYGIGFYAFDSFKRYMGRPLNGIEISTPAVGQQSGDMTWVQTPSAAFTFQRYGIGVAYIRIARLANGNVWEADMDYVLLQLQEIENSLTIDDIAQDD